MAIIKKTQIRPEDGNDYETILYPETSTDMVFDEATGKSIATLAGTPGGFATLDNEGNIPKEHLLKAPRVEILFGNGTDGNVTISSNTTLTRDMYYNNLTINNGRTLKTNGFKIFVKGTLTNNGTIENNGLDGGNATSDGPGSSRSNSGPYAGGSGGDGGRSTDSNPNNFGQGQTSNFDEFRSEFELIHRLYDTEAGNGGYGGTGGRRTSNSYSWGGGGGSGGEKVHIYAKRLINNGSIQSKGGNGGNGHAYDSSTASGGGGGGGGGVVLLVYEEFNGNNPDVSGGTGGVGGGSTSSTYRGKNGMAGRVIKIKLI